MKVYKDIVVGLPFSCPPQVTRTENGRWYIQFRNSDGQVMEGTELPPTHFQSWDSARWSANAHNNALYTAEVEKRNAMRVEPFREWYEPTVA
jgi:hypothetical protein